MLAYATVNGYIIGYDLRSKKEVWKLKNDPRKGEYKNNSNVNKTNLERFISPDP